MQSLAKNHKTYHSADAGRVHFFTKLHTIPVSDRAAHSLIS